MSKTWSNGFRDAHGSENAYRCEPGYDSGAGRFDQIRDNRPTKLYARTSSKKPEGIGKNLHNNNAFANSDVNNQIFMRLITEICLLFFFYIEGIFFFREKTGEEVRREDKPTEP